VKVRELPPGKLQSVDPNTTLAEIARRMHTDDCDAVAVMSGGKLAGIITERDLVQAIAEGVNPNDAEAHAVMSADPVTVSEDEEVAVVAMKMMQRGVRHLPVLNHSGTPVGLVSAGDLIPVLERGS
jgi:CBS domain-containing protein